MASITIRQLDEDLKKRLRLRAASHGRSMEDEVRTILRAAAAAPRGSDTPPRTRPAQVEVQPQAAPAASPSHGGRRVLLVIGGGIAAYKSLDLIRRLQERGLVVRAILTAAAQEFITPL